MSASDHTETIFQPSDLNRGYRAVLDQAKKDRARLRDTDGMSILLIPEAHVATLEDVNAATSSFLVLEGAISHGDVAQLSINEFGPWPWLRFLDNEDIAEFVTELRESLILAGREHSMGQLRETLHAWKVTAESLSDDTRRDVLLGIPNDDDDFVVVERPASVHD